MLLLLLLLLLQCSDIDGTMIGDTPRADELTWEFSRYWENVAALAKSVLVYNTGRSKGAFAKLLEDKQDIMAVPDVIITAVGTKVSHG